MKQHKIKILFSLFLNVLFFNFAFANDLSISQSPESPKEGEAVILKLDSDYFDLNKANIVWSLDGKEIDSGVGRKTHSDTAPIGGLKTIIVKVSQDGLGDRTASFTIAPNTSYILYEGSDSYVPPFYKGRALPGTEGSVRVSMFSFSNGEIKNINGNSDSNFTWYVNGEEKKVLGGLSRFMSIIRPSIVDKNLNIKIKETDSYGNEKTSESNVPLQKPEIIMYKTDDKYLVQNPISQNETGKSLNVVAEPFFYSVTNKRSKDLEYTWKLNDIVNQITNPWSVKLQGKEREVVKVILNLVNNKKLTQDGEAGFSLSVQ